ncbi:MAG: peptidoglycan DD-metalloendopeptidase family protein [Bacteroidaceae bacterium]|nr:peptidoglycan DD-metalloendopeptidase family protein [Bacteroidaceae bacterium]
MKNTLFAYLLPLLMLLFFAAGNAFAQNTSIKEMRAKAGTLRKDIAEKEKILLSSKKDVNSKLANLDIVTAKINDRKKLIGLINEEVKIINGEIRILNREKDMLQGQVSKSRSEYAEALRRARKYSSFNSKLMFIFSGNDFNTMLRRYRYVKEYMDAHKVLADSLKVKIGTLEKKRSELEAVRKAKKESLATLEAERTKLQGLENKQRAIVKELQKEYRKVEKELKKKRNDLNKLNKSIEREIEKALAAEREAKRRAAKKSGKGEPSKGSTAYKEDEGVVAMTGSFEKNRKKLPVPITGPYLLVERFGVKNAISGKGNVPINTGGITFEGNKGAKARCIFDGKVTAVFGSGNYAFVLVRHGKYISVYCNLKNIRVKGGSNIKAGDIIGEIAPDAKDGNPRMLFQIRLEKKTLNPEEWLSL